MKQDQTEKPVADQLPRKIMVRDPEVQAMDRLSRILNSLDCGTRARVLTWLRDRYAPPCPTDEETPY